MSGKRANLFGQGRPEDPYNERDVPDDAPQRATAAQLAARKIKTAKPRRAAGASSGLSQSVNFGGGQQAAPGGFNFGATAPIGGGAENGANGSGGMFGGFGNTTTSSFPPSAPASDSNTMFSNNSFTFGADNQSSNQQTGNGFNFSAGTPTHNPFGAPNGGAPATNGASTAFGGSGSIFGSQPASNPFGALQSTTSSASGSTSMFGTTNGASTTPFSFGGAGSSAAPEPSTPAPASPFNFGGNAAASSAPSFQFGATPAPATPGAGFQFGANSSTAAPAATPAPASTGMFGFGGGATQNGSATPAPAPAFGGFGATSDAKKDESTPAPASTGLFSFGASATPKLAEPATPAPATNMFGGAPTPAPANNLFSALQKPAESSTPKFSFGQTQEAPKAQEAAPKFSFGQTQETPKPAEPAAESAPKFTFGQTPKAPAAAEPTSSAPTFSFGQAKEAPKEPTAATSSLFNSAETPKSNPFGALPKPADTPAPNFSNMFGASQTKDSASKESAKPASTSLFEAPAAPKTNLFSGFGTPQPAKTAENDQAKAGMFTAPPKASGFTFGAASAQEPATPSKAPVTQETSAQQPLAKEPSNPFASLPGSSSSGGGLFGTPTTQPPASPTPANAPAPTLNTSIAPQLPKIGKLNVPKDWAIEEVAAPQNADETSGYIIQLATQLQHMNLKYREMISNVSPLADWSNLSIWHHTQSRALKTKIDDAKKQRAAAKGVTGFESALSTKRKVNAETFEEPSKRSRPAEPSTPTPKSSQPPTTTPKAAPPATATSNLFSKAISKGATPEKSAPEPPKAAAPSTGFTPSFSASAGPSAPKPSTAGFTPSFSASTGAAAPKATPAFGASNGTDASKSTTASTGFTPSFGASKASTASTGFTPSFGAPKAATSGGFTPSFGGSSSGGNTDFMAAFAKKAKTYEQLAAERKKKAKDEDFDSDDESEEQWSARYDKEEAERLAKEKEAVASASGFSLPGSSNASGTSTPTEATKELAKEAAEPKPSASTNLFANLAKPTSGASTPNMFRAASPALSTSGGRSVFDTPAAPSPSGNLFGHLSSGPSSAHQDDTDEDEDEHDDQSQAVGSTGSTSPKRKFGDSETESDDTSTKKQVTAPKKGSLLSRMTRPDDADSEAEKENDKPDSDFGQTNGTSTPANKPFAFFNFDAAGANTAPPKNAFAGDQTFKAGSPIKFGGGPATEKKKDGPTFQFQPATPSPADFSTTPAKPPPSGSLFSFGGGGSSLAPPNFGASAPSSVPSSVFSSRAGTPAAEAEANKDAAAADDEEGEKHEQVDLSQLTAEEKETTDVVFHIDLALAKQQVDQGDGVKVWENFARGPLWILKDKVTGKCFVRIRIPSGATPLNYQILPALRSTVAGGSRKMVQATRPGKDKGLTPVYFAVKSPEVAEEFSKKYNESMPSN